jgi:hypothetical protein
MHRMLIVLVANLALAGAAFAAPPVKVAPAKVTLDSIRVQFLYDLTGGLSEDVAPPSKFAIWNTVIGEGSAKEPADDVLVGVLMRSDAPDAITTQTLSVTVRKAGGKVLATHAFPGLILSHGRVVKSILLHDAACAGPVTIEAVYGAQRKVTKLDLACGE